MVTTIRPSLPMSWYTRVLLMTMLLVTACGGNTASTTPGSVSSAATPAATASSAPASSMPGSSVLASSSTAAELPRSGPLPAGRYLRSSFQPPVAFELEDGWSVGQVLRGFFDVQQQKGTSDVIAVQFAKVEGVIGASGASIEVTSASAAAKTIHDNAGLTVLEESESRMSGLYGSNVVVENAGDVHVGVLQVPVGALGIDGGRRLWISFFDTANGVIAVMVGGSVTQWQHTLDVAEPVLESVRIG